MKFSELYSLVPSASFLPIRYLKCKMLPRIEFDHNDIIYETVTLTGMPLICKVSQRVIQHSCCVQLYPYLYLLSKIQSKNWKGVSVHDVLIGNFPNVHFSKRFRVCVNLQTVFTYKHLQGILKEITSLAFDK